MTSNNARRPCKNGLSARIKEYLNETHSQELTIIRAHCNVFVWSDGRDKFKREKNDVD